MKDTTPEWERKFDEQFDWIFGGENGHTVWIGPVDRDDIKSFITKQIRLAREEERTHIFTNAVVGRLGYEVTVAYYADDKEQADRIKNVMRSALEKACHPHQ